MPSLHTSTLAGTQAPASGSPGQSPASAGGAQVPASGGGAQVPASGGGAQVPASGGGAQVPASAGAGQLSLGLFGQPASSSTEKRASQARKVMLRLSSPSRRPGQQLLAAVMSSAR